MGDLSFLRELLPLMGSLLLQRAIFLINNRVLAIAAVAQVEQYNKFFVILAIGLLFEMATIAAIVNFFSRVEVDVCLGVKKALRHNFALFLILSLIAVLMKEKLFTLLRIDGDGENNSFQNLYLTLLCLGALLGFSVIEGFLILRKLAHVLISIMLIMTITSVGCYMAILRAFGGAPVTAVLCSTMLSYLIGGLLGYRELKRRVSAPKGAGLQTTFSFFGIWFFEIKVAVVRAFPPFILAFFILRLPTGSALLAGYNLAVQLAYLAGLFYLAGMPIAIREQTMWQHSQAAHGRNREIGFSPFVKKTYLSHILLPTGLGLAVLLLSPAEALRLVFGYNLELEGVNFLRLFFLANLVGQIGHLFSLPIRGVGLVYVVTISILLSEVVIQSGFLVGFDSAGVLNSTTIGLAINAFTFSYFMINLASYFNLRMLTIKLGV